MGGSFYSSQYVRRYITRTWHVASTIRRSPGWNDYCCIWRILVVGYWQFIYKYLQVDKVFKDIYRYLYKLFKDIYIFF